MKRHYTQLCIYAESGWRAARLASSGHDCTRILNSAANIRVETLERATGWKPDDFFREWRKGHGPDMGHFADACSGKSKGNGKNPATKKKGSKTKGTGTKGRGKAKGKGKGKQPQRSASASSDGTEGFFGPGMGASTSAGRAKKMSAADKKKVCDKWFGENWEQIFAVGEHAGKKPWTAGEVARKLRTQKGLRFSWDIYRDPMKKVLIDLAKKYDLPPPASQPAKDSTEADTVFGDTEAAEGRNTQNAGDAPMATEHDGDAPENRSKKADAKKSDEQKAAETAPPAGYAEEEEDDLFS